MNVGPAAFPMLILQWPILPRILCVLQRWIQIQYEDFELNHSLLKTMKKFLEVDVRMCGFVMEAEYIERNINQKVNTAESLCIVDIQE